MLDTKTFENLLWEDACKIRGDIGASKYKNYILPLILLKRLSDVFEDEINNSLVRFYIPEKARWENIRKQNTNIGEYLTSVVREAAKHNEKLHGV